MKESETLQTGRKNVGTGEIAQSLRAISLFFNSVFKRLVLQTRNNQDLFGKGLTLSRARVAETIAYRSLVRSPVQPIFFLLMIATVAGFIPLPSLTVLSTMDT